MHRKLTRNLALISWLLLSTLAANHILAEAFIVKDGTPQAQIVVDKEPPRLNALAAQELQEYVEKISGAVLPIVTEPTSAYPVRIYIGRIRQYTDPLGLNDEGLEYGGFRMKCGENWLAFIGIDRDFVPDPWQSRSPIHYVNPKFPSYGQLAELISRRKAINAPWGGWGPKRTFYSGRMRIYNLDQSGSLNGVYSFLRDLGVRWYMPGELGEIVPRMSDIALPTEERMERPSFARRHYDFARYDAAPREDILWYLRQGLNRGYEIGGVRSVLVHGLRDLTGAKNREAHPEYFALYGNTRHDDRQCLSSPGLFEATVEYARTTFDLFGPEHAKAISVGPSDGYRMCECPLCKGKDTPERGFDGEITDYVWDFVNRVATEVYKTHPDRFIVAAAYGRYRMPPTRIKQFSPNVMVQFTQTRAAFYDDPDRHHQILEWRNTWYEMTGSRKMLIFGWNHAFNNPGSGGYGLPTYAMHSIVEDLRSLKGMAWGEFIEPHRNGREKGNEHFGLFAPAFLHLNIYMAAQFLWDVDQDYDALMSEYYRLFYGPAAEPMQAFIEYSEVHYKQAGYFSKRGARPGDPEVIRRMLALLAAAQQSVDVESVYGQRIARLAEYLEPLHELLDLAEKAASKQERTDVLEIRAAIRDVKSIVMDGRLDDSFWKDIPQYNLRAPASSPSLATTFRMAWADNALYLGIRCAESDMKNLRIGAEIDGSAGIWDGDNIDLLIRTPNHSYYQLAFSPIATQVSADRENRWDMTWQSHAEVAAYRGDDHWSLEVRIPVGPSDQAEIDPHGISTDRPSADQPWNINLLRMRVRGNDLLERASFTGENFHDVMAFAKLIVPAE